MMVMLDRVAQRYSINPMDLIDGDPYPLRMVQVLSAAGMLSDSLPGRPEREDTEPDDPLAEFME